MAKGKERVRRREKKKKRRERRQRKTRLCVQHSWTVKMNSRGGKRGIPVARCEIVIRRPSRTSAAIGVSIVQLNSFVCVLAGALFSFVVRGSGESAGKKVQHLTKCMNGAIICLEKEGKTRLVARTRYG